MPLSLFSIPTIVLLLSVFVSYYCIIYYNKAVPMANNGILFISNAAKAHKLCSKISKCVKNVLYINFNSGPESTLSIVNKQIIDIYSKVPKNMKIDIRLMLKPRETGNKITTNNAIELIMYDKDLANEVDNLKFSLTNIRENVDIESVENEKNAFEDVKEDVKVYDYVALGGTFDRLHNGHKILLSQAVLRAKKHVTVGVTDLDMIQSKKLWELIQPIEIRIKAVLDFLTDINPDLEYNVLPIQDVYGPTKDNPHFQLLVVSEETSRGAIKVNEKRKENGLNPLDVYTIGLAEDTNQQSYEEEAKLSSSNQRMRLLGTILREPRPNPNIPKHPYVIGLAGGIASGKSSITEKLKLKGAAILNCDVIAHELYKPGLPLNHTIAESFGNDVITDGGEVDRRKLGAIVFSDKSQLQRLNSLVWPAVIQEAQKRIKALGEAGSSVVVMEAAVMVQAGWYKYCHQLWTVIIPPEEAVKRLQARNNLSEAEAKQRVSAQPSNQEQVALANVVFSPYWSYEHTQGQVDRAWENLQIYLQ
ncbi:bifunctional coenzyme A synthase like protein [Danaus plexippus plexippus]|uniref:Bifunctional coenzyme A synthase n=1 Tax=Danaus plexippus plexippus TaxID=278856 RepID=A0A212FDA4_DANPL|nr:bifunctional coenzyme A synthase like protein [Danaus plexippus plexippus]